MFGRVPGGSGKRPGGARCSGTRPGPAAGRQRLHHQRRGPGAELHHPVRGLRPHQLRDVLREPPQHPQAPLRRLARRALGRAEHLPYALRRPVELQRLEPSLHGLGRGDVPHPAGGQPEEPVAGHARGAQQQRQISPAGRARPAPPSDRAAAARRPRPPRPPCRSAAPGPPRRFHTRSARYQPAVRSAPASTQRYSSSSRSAGSPQSPSGNGRPVRSPPGAPPRRTRARLRARSGAADPAHRAPSGAAPRAASPAGSPGHSSAICC